MGCIVQQIPRRRVSFPPEPRARRLQARREGVQSIFICYHRPSTSGDIVVRKSCPHMMKLDHHGEMKIIMVRRTRILETRTPIDRSLHHRSQNKSFTLTETEPCLNRREQPDRRPPTRPLPPPRQVRDVLVRILKRQAALAMLGAMACFIAMKPVSTRPSKR